MKFISNNFAKISVFNIVFAVILTSCSSSSATTSNSSTETREPITNVSSTSNAKDRVSSKESVSTVMEADPKMMKMTRPAESKKQIGVYEQKK